MNLFWRTRLLFSRQSASISKSLHHSFLSQHEHESTMIFSMVHQLQWRSSTCYSHHQGRSYYKGFCGYQYLAARGIHTSKPRFAAPLAPLAAFLVKLAGPLSKAIKLAAIVGGRTFRKNWKKLSASNRLHLSKGVTIFIGGFGGVCLGFYFFHLEETPVTHRKRFMPISHKQMVELTAKEYKNVLEAFAEHILPTNHPDHVRVFRVAMRLLLANLGKEMNNLSWQVNVVESEEINAFVLPNGQIFMFTGMLKLLHNDDTLATVLGHEISHAILQHAAEQVSLHGFINMFLVISLALLWALLPTDLLAFGAQWLQDRILVILLHLPYSRRLEEEADEVGMTMAAKACFDVRESPRFWWRLAVAQDEVAQPEALKWLSTHPSHSDRAQKLETLLPKALETRTNCRCPPLPGVYGSIGVNREETLLSH